MSQKSEMLNHIAQDKIRQDRVKRVKKTLYDAQNEVNLKKITDEKPFFEEKSIVDTMSGDPIKAAHDQKVSRR